jgi:NTE family protein
MQAQLQDMPKDLAQGLSLTLDWALLASYRTALKMLKAYNRLAEAAERLERAAEAAGDASLRMVGPAPKAISEPLVIAPQRLMPLEWIIDYEEQNHQALFQMGYDDAVRALDNRLLSQMLS